jgi:hypothetical protein
VKQKSLLSGLFGIAISALAVTANAADIVNGWSGATTIAKVYSLGNYTLYKLNGWTNGCGHMDHWMLPLVDTLTSKTKQNQLLLAFAANKTVNVRCENSQITDFEIYQ